DPADDIERPGIQSIPVGNGKWLKMPRKGFVFPNSFENLPEQFTLEFDLYADPQKMSEMEGGFRTNFVALDDRKEYSMYWASEPSIELDVHPHGSTKFVHISAQSEYNSNLPGKKLLFENTFKSDWNPGAVNRVSIYRNGNQVALYLNGKEMFNLPNGLSKKAQYNLIFSTNMWGDGMYLSNVRIAGNVPNATNEMKSAGKFVTNSIYFDVNSSRIKPESWATLNNTAQAIKATSGNILIVGHTDSDGADDANLKLSQSRAASVKNALVKEFGIDASRLVTDGKGETQPITSNNTASGKAQNRRVEFVRQ
ncbi:MAG: OmpA family protein, partial [Taibaiella sp.]|nr:OmpA family protein [Taibaiella sp.]